MPTASMPTTRPKLVTVAGWWLIVTSMIAWALQSAQVLTIDLPGVPTSAHAPSLILPVVLATVGCALGWGLLAGRRWARGSVLGLGALSVAGRLWLHDPEHLVALNMVQYFFIVIALTAPLSGRWFRECESRRMVAHQRRQRTRQLAAKATRRQANI